MKITDQSLIEVQVEREGRGAARQHDFVEHEKVVKARQRVQAQ